METVVVMKGGDLWDIERPYMLTIYKDMESAKEAIPENFEEMPTCISEKYDKYLNFKDDTNDRWIVLEEYEVKS